MSKSNETTGISFLSMLGILFITLKLTGVISWSWLWVLSPIWIPFALIIIIFLFAGLAALISVLINKSKN